MQKRYILGLAKTGLVRVSLQEPTATIEYRVTWNERDAQWDVRRNGVDTNTSRRKKQSAIDLAIREAQAEVNTSRAKILVTTMEGRKVKTEWTRPVIADASGRNG